MALDPRKICYKGSRKLFKSKVAEFSFYEQSISNQPAEISMPYNYDDQNVFAKILRGELPCKKIYESEHSLAFEDIAPLVPNHYLVIPKGQYVCFDDFSLHASAQEIVDYVKAIGKVVEMLGLAPGNAGEGYRILSNTGKHGVQMVPHLHIHLFGGKPLGRMLSEMKNEQ